MAPRALTRLGKNTVLIYHYFRGRPVLAMTPDLSVYQRKDGSYFIHDRRRQRMTIVKRDDGTFYLRSDYNP